MLSSGVESHLDSSVSAVIEELHTGLPESISTELMAVSEPNVGLDAKSDVSTPVLAHSDSLSAKHHRTSGAENFCQKTEDSGDKPNVISHGPAELLTEELRKAGALEEDEKNKKRNFRKLDCSCDGYQKEDREAQDVEEYHAECCALTPGESWSKQEDPHLNQHEVKSSRTCCTEIVGSLKNTEENQANVQVTAETLPKLTEEVQVFSSVASSPEEFSKEKFKMVPSEGYKLKKDQWQFSVGHLCKDDIKENSLLMVTSNIASHEIGKTDICFYNTSSKISPPSTHSCLDLSTKLEKDSPKAQLLEKESESNTVSDEMAGSLVEATEANSNDSLSAGKETNLIYTLNVPLPPVAQKSREPHRNECPPCTANEVSSRDKAQYNLSGKESVGASGTTGEQVAEIVLHKDKLKSSVSSRTFDNPNMTSKISQKNMKSSARDTESVVTGLENEHSDTWNCNYQSIKDQCTAASTSNILSGSTCVGDVLPNSHSFNVEVDKKIEENCNLEGEASAGYNSKKTIIFPEARFPLACGSLPCEDDWGNRGIDLHGINDISTAKNMFCSAYTAEKSVATLVGDEISNKNMEVVKQFDRCKVTDGSEIVCDRDEAKEQINMCALQTEFDKIRTVDSPKVPEGNRRNKTSEQLLVRYLNKKNCVHNFGFCNSPLGPEKREVGTYEKKEVSSLTANPSEYSASICDTCPLLNNMNIQTRHASQTEKTLRPTENQCLACQSEFDSSVPGSKQHSESLNNQPNTGLQTTATSLEETKISIGSSQSEEILLKTGDDPPLLAHKYAREDSFQGTLKKNVVDLDFLNGMRNEGCSGYVGFISDLTEKTIEPKEHENRCEREDRGTLEESFSDTKSHCYQHACFIKCAKEKAELVFAGEKMQQSLPKMKWLVEDQENTASAPFFPFSSIHGSLSYKPENMNVLSETENKKSLRIKSILNNSCPQLTFEPGKEADAKKGIGPSHFGKFDIQESFNETQADSETLSALNLGISLPEKQKLCMSSENTPIDNRDSSSGEVFSKDSSVTKPLSVTTSVKRKASNAEIPSSENEMAASFLNGAKSSRVCAHSKDLRDEGHSMLTVKDMDVTSPKSTRCGEKFKNTCVEKKMGREVAPRKKLPVDSFRDGEDCLWALLEDSKESGSKRVPLSTENYGKVLEEIPRSNLSNLSKERKNATKLTNLSGTSLLSETVHGCQAEDTSDTEASPELQYNTTPTFYPCMSILSNSCKESSPNCVVCSEVCVPYKLNAQSKDDVKEITEGQDTIPTHSVCKENEALGSERLDQTEKCQVLKRKKKYKMEVHPSDKAQQEQKSEYQEKAKTTLQPSMLSSSELLCSSSKELVTSRNTRFEGPSEEIFAVRSSENKLCSTLQEVKRPKITTDIISSQFLKTQDSEMENLNLNLGCDGIPGAFGTTNKLRAPLPLKRQPGRTCKKVPTSYQLKTVRKSKKIKSSSFFEIPPEISPKQENTRLKSSCFPYKPPTMEPETAMRFMHMPRQRAERCSLLSSLKCRKCTKEPALLSKLSAMASKLLAPARSIHNLEPLPYSSEILPVSERYSQRRSKNLLEAFSCINRNLHSRWADSWCTKMFSFQPLALYPAESTQILFSDLSHKPPTSSLDTPVFPISFHIKLDSSPVTDLTGITFQHSVHHRPVLGEMPAPPSKWTFSFLLSQSCSDTTAFKEDSSLHNELHSSLSVTTPRAAALHPDRGRNAIAERRGGCSMLGLHTVLALSSPGCYRIWTRRRNLTSHIPTIQRLFISQFAQGLKGARYPTSVSDDLVSSLPYSLGRVLSIWSQHGPSAHPSEITPLHSSHCKWQPSVGIENSYAMLPHLPVQSMEALQTAGHKIHLETSFPLPLPKSLPESSPSPPRLSVSELQVHALDEADASVPACLRSQDDTELKKTEPEKRPKKVSQIRIRKTVPKPDPNLTPMGLPKPKRLKKKEFSLEEIYTNKNYKSPPPARSLETIFEEPKEKNGRLISVSQQKRKRILEFQDFTIPRKRKIRGKIKAVGSFTRAKKAALQSEELDALLSQKLMDLEAFFAKEAEQQQASSI
ncbi:protein PRR14L isoform X1 [Pelecanus crispus]|uniref:protein PRR14L isoform X1 n=1 Tax=Pelecanus crispus TaxID=36300 RepID=UPI003F5D2F04